MVASAQSLPHCLRPPSTNANVIGKAFEEGWGPVVTKTCCLRAERIINVAPPTPRLRAEHSDEIFGWRNIELIQRPGFSTWLAEFRQLKERYPDRVLGRVDHGGVQPRRLDRDRRARAGPLAWMPWS